MSKNSLSDESMLVKLENLDRLLSVAGDVIINSSNLEFTYKHLQVLFSDGNPVDEDTLRNARELAEAASQISSNLHQLVCNIRTVDLKDMVFRGRRTVREIARKTGKRVEMIVEGENTTIDKTIIESLYDPVMHQLGNAVTHGIEDSLTRTRKGKPEEGHIYLRGSKSETEAFIEIEDDGAGLDMPLLRQRALDMGLVGQQDEFTEEVALQVICQPGISTAAEISEVSGRGVGMDVVREGIEELGGSISLKTTKGRGSTFSFRVPLVSAVNILDGLVVFTDRHIFAFPIINVVASLSLTQAQIHHGVNGEMVKHLGDLLPLYNLDEVIDPDDTYRDDQIETSRVNVLIIDHKGERIALRVKEFGEPRKLVIIPFDGILDVEGLSGTTVLGGKKMGFIVNVPCLLARALGEPKTEAHSEIQDEPEAAPETLSSATHQAPEQVESQQGQDIILPPTQENLIESKKVLASLNAALFALESNPEKKELINQSFRLFHTLKGNFLMMSQPKAAETLHAVESVLNRARDSKLELNADVMDNMMDGVSYAETVLKQMSDGTWRDQHSTNILSQSAALLPKPKSETVRDVDAEPIECSHEAHFRQVAHRKRATPIYQLYMEFESKKEPIFLLAILAYKRFCEMGDVLGTMPPIGEIEKGLIKDRMKILFACDLSPGHLEETLTHLLTTHYSVSRVRLSRFG